MLELQFTILAELNALSHVDVEQRIEWTVTGDRCSGNKPYIPPFAWILVPLLPTESTTDDLQDTVPQAPPGALFLLQLDSVGAAFNGVDKDKPGLEVRVV